VRVDPAGAPLRERCFEELELASPTRDHMRHSRAGGEAWPHDAKLAPLLFRLTPQVSGK
jgi:hypothetical protein